jgi:hypothetical protein
MPLQAFPSDYKFTQPIRYYKANDPYYYEVDNLPLRQLEENVLWMKDQLFLDSQGLGGPLRPGDDIDIENLKPLRAKSEGARTISVNPGKFTARINSSMYGRGDYLSYLIKSNTTGTVAYPKIMETLGDPTTTSPGPYDPGADGQEYTDFFMNFVQQDLNTVLGRTAEPMRLTGLETLFTHHIGGAAVSPGPIFGEAGTKSTGTESGVPEQIVPGNSQLHRWPLVNHASIAELDYDVPFVRTFENLTLLHTEFVQFWRSVVRTSVVDFRGGTIEIPAFDPYDFYYEDAFGNDVSLSAYATQRIDLLVVYSMPIDDTSAALAQYDSAGTAGGVTPKVITQPTLGLIKGAGVGIIDPDPAKGPHIKTKEFGPNTPDPDMPKILANIHDANVDANYGLMDRDGTVIHGSFPSPDDLVNITPNFLITEDSNGVGGNTNLQHIGQTAIPVAYVVVKNCSNITTTDIIDIRPFLRTAELSYNERAGVAAAYPPLSFANPAVGTMQLQDAIDRIPAPITPRSASYGVNMYSDVIQGGLSYGPEGCLLMMYENYTQATDGPWGILKNVTNYTNGAGTTGIDLSILTNPWTFTQAPQSIRKAAIEYLYNNHQADLKSWLGNAEGGAYTKYGGHDWSTHGGGVGEYLNLPTDRKISLWPEWDAGLYGATESSDLADFVNQYTVDGKGNHGLPCNTWNFFDYVGGTHKEDHAERTPKYFSAGMSISTNPVSNEIGGFGYGGNYLNAMPKDLDSLVFCKKTINLLLPSWVEDFDVNVDYVNSLPTAPGQWRMPNSMGLRIQKGGLIPLGDMKVAYFTIVSAGGGIAFDATDDDNGLLYIDRYGTNNIYQQEANFLGYKVIQPEWQQPFYTMYRQQVGMTNGNLPTMHADSDHTKRKMARFGLCHYPTVKFNIVGYPQRKTVFPEGIATQQGVPGSFGTPSHSVITDGDVPPVSYEGFLDLRDETLLS